MPTPEISRSLQRTVANNYVDSNAPADTSVGYVEGRGRDRVEQFDKMMAAATFSDLEKSMNKNEIAKTLQQDNNLIGPQQPMQPAKQFSGNLQDAAMQTVDWEARRDAQGNLEVYDLPSGDRGGSYEVAGINNRYHPEAAEILKSLPADKRQQYAANYISEYTSPVTSKVPDAYKPFFQDMAFNRGLAGSVKFAQRALGLQDDGILGPKTLSALQSANPSEVMRGMSIEQLKYEDKLRGMDPERNKFYPGLKNRVMNRYNTFGGQA